MKQPEPLMQYSSLAHRQDQRVYGALWVVSFAAHLYYIQWVLSPLDTMDSDMLVYIELAINYFYGYGAIDPLNTISLPGINYFFGFILKVFGLATGFTVLNILQAAILSTINVLTGLITYALFKQRWAAWLVAIIVAAYWPFWGLISYYMAELMQIFFMLLAYYWLIQAIETGAKWECLMSIGLLLGLAMMMKGQAIVAVVAVVLFLLILPVAAGRRHWAGWVMMGFMIPIGLQVMLHHRINPAGGWYMALVDSYNFYLAQSRMQGIAALEWHGPGAYTLHTYANDTDDEQRFLPLAIVEASILDRPYYQQKSWELIREQPYRQWGRAVTSVRELFRYGEGWPFRYIKPVWGDAQVLHQIKLWLVMLPAALSLILALGYGYYRWQVILVSLPVLGIMALAVIYSGQPRYLMPFYYYLFIGAVPFYLWLARGWARLQPVTTAQ